MKKLFIIAVASVALLASCAKTDKCKCVVKVGNMTLENQIVSRPEDKACSRIKVEDIKGDIVSVDLSKMASIDCVNYYEEE